MSEKKKKKLEVSDVSHLIEDIRVDNEVPVLEKIRYPTVWDRLPSGYRIQDLQLTKVENAVEIVKDHYVKEDVFCRGVGLVDDDEAVSEYLSDVTHWLKDTQSLAAVEEGSGTVVGVLIGRVLDRTVQIQYRMAMQLPDWMEEPDSKRTLSICVPMPCENHDQQTASTVKLSRGSFRSRISVRSKNKTSLIPDKSQSQKKWNPVRSILKTSAKAVRVLRPIFDDEETIIGNAKSRAIHQFKTSLTRKHDVFSLYNVTTYYSIYLLAVTPEHRDSGIDKALLRCALDMAGRFGCDIVTGIFASKRAQNMAHRENFKILEEVPLSSYSHKNVKVFPHLGGSEKAAYMVYVTSPPPEPSPTQSPSTPPRRRMDKK